MTKFKTGDRVASETYNDFTVLVAEPDTNAHIIVEREGTYYLRSEHILTLAPRRYVVEMRAPVEGDMWLPAGSAIAQKWVSNTIKCLVPVVVEEVGS